MATNTQLQRLKEHKYSAQGKSLLEPLMQPFWCWLVTQVPLWLAPNLITFIGLVVNVATSLLVVFADPRLEGKAPRWSYLACALGFFIYQSLDAIDGKQARRTGSNTPLGELFDHGCDAISTYLVVLTALSTVAIHGHFLALLVFTEFLMTLNFAYHWQTYVRGTLCFNLVDVTEAQFFQIALLLTMVFFGPEFWHIRLPIVDLPLNMAAFWSVSFFCCVNMAIAAYGIATGGVGRNGTSVANTSVLSPITTPLIIIPPLFLYPESPLLSTDTALYLAAFTLPHIKHCIVIIFSAMTKHPYPLFDHIMLGPWLLVLNSYCLPLPEFWVFLAIALFEIADILVLCVRLCWQICNYLDISCFTIPYSPK